MDFVCTYTIRVAFTDCIRVSNYSKEERDKILHKRPHFFPYILNPDWENKVKAVSRHPANIAYINYPTFKFLETILHYGNNLSILKLVNNTLTEKVMFEIFNKYPQSLQYFPKPTYKLALMAITKSSSNFKLLREECFSKNAYKRLEKHYKNRLVKEEKELFENVYVAFDDNNKDMETTISTNREHDLSLIPKNFSHI